MSYSSSNPHEYERNGNGNGNGNPNRISDAHLKDISMQLRFECLMSPSVLINLNKMKENQHILSRYDVQHRTANSDAPPAPSSYTRNRDNPYTLINEIPDLSFVQSIVNEMRTPNNTNHISASIYHLNNNDGLAGMLLHIDPAVSNRLYDLYVGINPNASLQDVPTPLSNTDIHKLEKCEFSTITKEKLGRGDIDYDCAICRSQFAKEDNVTILPCSGKHYFHDDCIKQWLSNFSKKCPVCRDNIEDAIKCKS